MFSRINLLKPTIRLNRIIYSFARTSKPLPFLQEQKTLIQSLNLTLSALLEIERRKPGQPEADEYIREQGWRREQQGHLIELSRKVLNKEVSVIVPSLIYPVNEEPVLKEKNPSGYRKEKMYEFSLGEEAEAEETPANYLEFKVYIRRQNSPTYLIIDCSMSQHGVYPYIIDFTIDKQRHKLGRDTQTWNKLDDLTESLTDYLKRYLQLLGVDDLFGYYLIKHTNTSLKAEYSRWVKDMREFINE